MDRVKATVEQAVMQTLGHARLPEVTFTTPPTVFVVQVSEHHAETTVTRPVALSTGSGKYPPRPGYQILLTCTQRQ